MLGASALWPAALHGAGSPALATAALVGGLAAACWTVLAFRRLHAAAALLLLPYCAWIAAAALSTTRF